MEDKTCCCHKTKERTEEEVKKLLNRLSRIEGQIRGIRGMVEKKTPIVRTSWYSQRQSPPP